MTLVLVVILAQATPASPDLEQARALMNEGEHEGAAAAAAAAVAADPGSGPAYLLLGMAYFHAERYVEALEAFRSARSAPEPAAPGPLAFNEGSALFAMARFEESERAFQEAAARDPKLGLLCALNAAEAALGTGALDRARTHLESAEHLPGADALAVELSELRDEIERREAAQQNARTEALRLRGKAALQAGRLEDARAAYQQLREEARARGASSEDIAELAYAEGLICRRAGRSDEAAALLGEAVTLEPDEADYHFMAGVVAFEQDLPDAARASLERSLQLGLDRADAEIAYESLDALSLGLRRMGQGLHVAVEMGTGYDSNVGQLSAGRVELASGEGAQSTAGYWGSLSVDVSAAKNFGRLWFGEISYWLEQQAFEEQGLEIYNLQSHVLSARGELTPRGPFRLGLAVEGEYQFAGLRDFGFLLRSFAAVPHVALDGSAHTATVLRLRLEQQDAAPEESHLDGRRIELRLSQLWRSRRLRGEVVLRHRWELIGTRTVDLGSSEPRGFVQERYVAPYAYGGSGIIADVSVSVTQSLRIGIGGAFERLRYREDSIVQQITPLGGPTEIRRVRREDRRLSVGAHLDLALTDILDASLRYDLVENRSNVDLAFDQKDYRKHTVTLSIGAGF